MAAVISTLERLRVLEQLYAQGYRDEVIDLTIRKLLERQIQKMEAARTSLRRRWDNSPHFPGMVGFPHHCHIGSEDTVEPSQIMDLDHLLNLISKLIVQRSGFDVK
jgi:hypothetical protein